MALTRSQLIAGDISQGPVLQGQVQGVKQGNGVLINPDGTIEFRASTSVGVVKLNNNNPATFNGYVWPVSSGAADTFLRVDGNGNLSWAVPAGLVNLNNPPANPKLGELWFSYATNLLYVRQDKGGTANWKPVYQGLNPLPTNTSGNPAFAGGQGSAEEPFDAGSVSTKSGNTVLLPSTITITGLAPYQYVSIYDGAAEENGYRFQPTTNFADQSGTLSFKIRFTDFPQTAANTAYLAEFRVGFDEPIFIIASAGITSALNIVDPGTITGTPEVGEQLSYVTGIATGGTPPYSYTWVWKLASTNATLQTGGSTYVVGPTAANDRIFVELTATDNSLDMASANTGVFPTAPNFIQKGTFPNTSILFPTTTNSESSTLWADAGTQLSSDGCIQFSVDGINFSQGPTQIANGGTITTRWTNSANCSQAANSSVITGCVFSDLYRQCSSLTIDKVPSPFLFNPVNNIIPGSVATSQTITPIGYNSSAHVTYNPTSSGTNVEASLDGGSTWQVLSPTGGTSVTINPGQTLAVRMTTGSDFNSQYTAIINIGTGSSVQSATFTATTTTNNVFATPIGFPTTTINEVQTTWLAGDGSTSLTATGCIQFKVGPSGTWTGAGDPAVAITTGNILYTRWSNTTPGTCGRAPHGTTITGTITNTPSGGSNTNTASLSIDRVPSAVTFTDLNNQAPSTVVSSNTVNITGSNAPAFITRATPGSALGSVEVSIAGGPWTAVPTSGETLFVDPVVSGAGNTLQLRGTTGGANNTTYSTSLNIGQGASFYTDTWDVTTSAITPSIVTPSIVTPINGATNLNPNSSSPPGITVTASAYSAINGAGSHTGTDWEVYYLNAGTPVYAAQVTNDPVNLTSYFVPLANILPNKTYFARVRYRTTTPSALTSNWSNLSSFSTATSFNLNWVLRRAPSTDEEYNLTNNYGSAMATDPSSGGTTTIVRNVTVRRTTNGLDFDQNKPNIGDSDLTTTGVAFGGGKFVLLRAEPNGSATRTFTSANGGSWTQAPVLNNTFLYSITYSPTLDLFCAVGLGGKIYTSPSSSIAWTQRTSPTTQILTSVIWDGTTFRACGGTAYLSSSNGLSWSLTTIPNVAGEGLYRIAHNPNSGRYVMTRNQSFEGELGGSVNYLHSSNGTTWTSAQAPRKISEVQAGGNWFVATFNSATIQFDPLVLIGDFGLVTSFDGITWNDSLVIDFNSIFNLYYYYSLGNSLGYRPQENRFIWDGPAGTYSTT